MAAVNLLLLEPGELSSAGTAEIHGARALHVARILRRPVGETLRVGVVGGRMGEARIVRTEPDLLELRVVHLDHDPPPPLSITVALALPRPPVFRRLLAHLAALGTKRIEVFHAARVEKSYWQSPVLASDVVRAALTDGLSQGCDTVLPEVRFHRRFGAFAVDVLEAASGEMVLWADPYATRPCPAGLARPVTLLVGPEGGFLPYEVERLEALEMMRVTLGPRILRTETAVVALIGRVAPGPLPACVSASAAVAGEPC